MATAEILELMTAEEFGKRPDPGYPKENHRVPPGRRFYGRRARSWAQHRVRFQCR
jgi:hypothetical protein